MDTPEGGGAFRSSYRCVRSKMLERALRTAFDKMAVIDASIRRDVDVVSVSGASSSSKTSPHLWRGFSVRGFSHCHDVRAFVIAVEHSTDIVPVVIRIEPEVELRKKRREQDIKPTEIRLKH